MESTVGKVPAAEGTRVMRADQRPDAGRLAEEALSERPGDREALGRRLERLPPGHPSSPVRDQPGGDATSRPDETGGRDGESRAVRPAEDTDRRPLTDGEHADHVAKVRDLLDKARSDGLATESRYITDPDKETWSRERRTGHNAIITDLYAAARDVPCERRAILAGGLPGAGKTTVLEKHAGVDRSRYLTINPDDVKEEMAKRGMIPQVPGLTPMEASELVHEESSHVAKRLARRAMRGGMNVIWDITMSSRESTERRINDLRSFGYSRVEGIFVDIRIDTSIERADARHRRDHDHYRTGQGNGGRCIAPETVSAQADADWGSRNRRTFEQVKPQLDGWARYDNSVDGRPAQLIDRDAREDTQ
jgi:predicted kinase